MAVVSAAAAQPFWPGRDPRGARLRLGDSPWMTVVGVAADSRLFSIDEPGEVSRPLL